MPTWLRAHIDTTAASLMEEGATPALPALVIGVLAGQERTIRGFGDAGDGRIAPDGKTVFRIASVTKPLTALLVATEMAATGQSDARQPVTTCPEAPALCHAGTAATWQHLLTHTAGLPGSLTLDGQDAIPVERFLHNYELQRAPGTRFEYSTPGYAAIGWALARRLSSPYEALLAERVSTPLGMVDTGFASRPGRTAVPHRDGAAVADVPGPADSRPSGGAWSTADDLLRLLAANLAPDSNPELSAAIRLTQEVVPNVRTFPGSSAAMGWFFFEPLGAYWGAGSAHGYQAFVGFVPAHGTAVVLLTNTGLPHGDPRLAVAAFGLLGELGARPVPP